MPNSKTKINNYYKKICEQLDSDTHTFILDKLTNIRGYYDEHTYDIGIDYRDEMLPTLIHEMLHHMHSDWDEDKILKMESYLINNFSSTQIKNIIKKFATKL